MRKKSSTHFHNSQRLMAECPVHRSLDALGNRWRAVVLWKVMRGERRFGALQRAIPPITQKMLAQELRELEQRGLLSRHVITERPRHVEYEVTPLGQTLHPVLEQLYAWGEAHPFPPSLPSEDAPRRDAAEGPLSGRAMRRAPSDDC